MTVARGLATLNGVTTTANATWTFTAGDYLDVTVFGDTVRTYLRIQPETVLTISDTEGRDVRLTFNPWHRTRTQTHTAPNETIEQIEVPATAQIGGGQLATGYLRLYGRHLWGANGNITTTNTDLTFTGQAEQVPMRLAYDEQVSQWLREELNAINATYAEFGPYNQELKVERAKAHRRAMALLKSHLSPGQLANLREFGYFYVQGEHLTYRIARSGEVRTLRPYGDFCFAPYSLGGDAMPGPDRALSVKIMIEADEAEFLRVANWSGVNDTGETISLGRMGINGVAQQTTFATRLYGGGKTHVREPDRFLHWAPVEFETPT